MTYGKAAWLLPALMLHAAGAGAATREEVERFTASQQPGSALVCRGEGALEAGVHRMTITSFARATVVSRRDGRQHLRAEAAFATDGIVYARYTYEMDSWLEDDAEVSVIVPESIHVLVPENEAEADAVARTVEASGTQRLPFRDVDASGFPEWDLLPQPDDPTGMRVHCGPEDRAG